MTTDRRHRSYAIQPQLPLPALPAAGDDPATGPVPDGGDQWRLDDQTRLIGRRGIAEARARLEEARRVATGGAGAGPDRGSGRAA
jgi:hypothetical protein